MNRRRFLQAIAAFALAPKVKPAVSNMISVQMEYCAKKLPQYFRTYAILERSQRHINRLITESNPGGGPRYFFDRYGVARRPVAVNEMRVPWRIDREA